MVALGYALSLGYGGICLLFAFLLSRLGVEKRITRKLVHILIGFEWVILYLLHGATVHFLAVCIAFLLLLAVAYKKNLLKMISSEDDNAPGTVYYAVSMSVMATVSIFEPRLMLPFGVAVFATSFGDGFAGLIGQFITKRNPRIYKNKSLVGTIANLLFSTLSAAVFMLVFPEMGLLAHHCILIGLLAAGIELISGFGLDNIFLPLSVSAFTYCLTVIPATIEYAVPIVATPFVVAFVIEKRALTRGGLFAAIFLDLAVSLALGNAGFTLLFAFLALGIFTDKLKHRSVERSEEKGSCRDAIQVLANGAVPALAAMLNVIFLEKALIIAYVAALSEALGDTAASAIGSHSKTTVDIFRFKKCKKGISGGVSLLGTLAALIFVTVIPMIALAFGLLSLYEALLAALVAFAGVIFDSFLGSLLQAKYKCSVCGELVERKTHCGLPTEKRCGVSFINNDAVNAFSTLFAAALAALCYLMIC